MLKLSALKRKLISYACIMGLVVTMMPAVHAATNSDISGHWAESQISEMIVKGSINGYPDNTFKPDSFVTRAEFMVIVNNMFGFNEETQEEYKDVSPAAWYAGAVSRAVTAGYIGGYDDGTIRPNGNVTRLEAAVMLARILNLSLDSSGVEIFRDSDSIPIWCKGEVGAAVAAGLMKGYPDGLFRGATDLTRAEAACLVNISVGQTAPSQSSTASQSSNTSKGGSKHTRYADMVLQNGYVYSVNGVEYDAEEAVDEAIAIRDGEIIYVGTSEKADKYVGPDTEVVDLAGKMVLPGFADAHNHPQAMASSIFALSLYGLNTVEQYQDAVQGWIAANPESTFITGNGWDTTGPLPDKDDLDAICSDIPVALYDSAHHTLWTNSKAMEIAGIDENTLDPPGGSIERDAFGTPTGIFREDSAMSLVMAVFPDFSIEEYKIGILAYQEMVNSYGVTLTQDCVLPAGGNAVEAYRQLAEEGMLTLRVRGTYTSSPALSDDGGSYAEISEAAIMFDNYIDYVLEVKRADKAGDLFQMNAVKIFEDGGGYTFYLNDDFPNQDMIPEEYQPKGKPVWPYEQLELFVAKLQENGLQIHVHAMGDGAVTEMLDAFENARNQGFESYRNTITHLMLVDDSDVDRMAEFGVVGAPQPYWMVRDNYYSWMYLPLLGEERTNRLYPMQSLVEAGVIMASSSDWPVTSPNAPLLAIQSGVTRTIAYDSQEIAVFIPDLAINPEYRYPLGPTDDPTVECASIKTMIQSSTINAAYATFLEDVTGSIEVGKSADLVVLDKNIFDVPAEDIAKINVMMTLFQGEIVYNQNSLTVSNHDVVLSKVEPNMYAPDAPYLLTVPEGIMISELMASLNSPMGGSVELLDGDGAPIIEGFEATVDDNMVVRAIASDGTETVYSIEFSSMPALNGFTVIEVTEEGCTITLDEEVDGDIQIYLLRDENKVNAVITDIDTDDGLAYTVTALDLGPAGELLPLAGTHLIYVYADGYDFGDSQGEAVEMP